MGVTDYVDEVLEYLWDKFWNIPNPLVWIIEKIGGKPLCKYLEKISPQLCEMENDQPVYFKNYYIIQIIVGLLVAAWLLFPFIGPVLPFILDLGPTLTNLGKFLWDSVKFPVQWAVKIITFFKDHMVNFNAWVADKTSTMPELWYTLEITFAVLGVTDLILEIIQKAFAEPFTSYFWRIFFFLKTPLDWMKDAWFTLFNSDWNPLKWLIMVPYILGLIAIFILTPILNLINPLRWFQKILDLFN